MLNSVGSVETNLDSTENIPSNHQRSPSKSQSDLKSYFAATDLEEEFKDGEFINTSNDSDLMYPVLKDVDCGVPFRAHSFSIDFTPIPGVDDNKELQKKCLDLWEFINNQPELQKLVVLPEDDEYSVSSITSESELTTCPSPPVLPETIKWITPGKMKASFAVDDTCKTCNRSVSSSSYKTGSLVGSSKDPNEKKRIILTKLNKLMDEFDLKNPKTMDPPGLAPTLIHAVMQRCPNRIKLPCDKALRSSLAMLGEFDV